MKKLNISLSILLLIFCGLLYGEVRETDGLREAEQQLIHDREQLQEQISFVSQSIRSSETELEDLKNEKQPVLEAYDVWQKRTEEIRSLLSD